MRRFDEAARCYEETIRLYPKKSDALHNLAYLIQMTAAANEKGDQEKPVSDILDDDADVKALKREGKLICWHKRKL